MPSERLIFTLRVFDGRIHDISPSFLSGLVRNDDIDMLNDLLLAGVDASILGKLHLRSCPGWHGVIGRDNADMDSDPTTVLWTSLVSDAVRYASTACLHRILDERKGSTPPWLSLHIDMSLPDQPPTVDFKPVAFELADALQWMAKQVSTAEEAEAAWDQIVSYLFDHGADLNCVSETGVTLANHVLTWGH